MPYLTLGLFELHSAASPGLCGERRVGEERAIVRPAHYEIRRRRAAEPLELGQVLRRQFGLHTRPPHLNEASQSLTKVGGEWGVNRTGERPGKRVDEAGHRGPLAKKNGAPFDAPPGITGWVYPPTVVNGGTLPSAPSVPKK